jgi:uncharacterized SAM-binding protein YcdF (DUF218 family)
MFLLKKLITPFFLPLSVSLELLLIGVVLLWAANKQKAGKVFLSLGLLLLGLISYDFFPDRLLRPLESRYSPLTNPRSFQGIKWVVVFGGGLTDDFRLPAQEKLSSHSLARLIEGIRLHRELPQTKLLLSGGAVFGSQSSARIIAEAAAALGVNPKVLVLETESRDTQEEAFLIQRMLKKDPFILVTSAAHMPRSMAHFKRLGLDPIPAPADFQAKRNRIWSPGNFFPSAQAVSKAQIAVHEYLGLAWDVIKDKR